MPGVPPTTAELAEVWRYFVDTETRGYSPIYTAIVSAMAEDEDVLRLVLDAPPGSHYPLLLLAAVHDLVLAGDLPELAAVYRGDAPLDAAPALFRDAVLGRREQMASVLTTRFVQTNETGRAAPIALALAALAAITGDPAALVDAGASAGLNLLYDRYRLDFGDDVLGDPDSTVLCQCAVDGIAPAPVRLVDVPVRVGLDRAPVDVTDPVAARWLLACTWPDTGRLERTAAALAIAAAAPPEVRTGDMVDGLGPLLSSLDVEGPVCVLTSWAASYLDGGQRTAFGEVLADAARERPVAWLSLEGPGIVRGVDAGAPPSTWSGTSSSVIGLTTFAPTGAVAARPLAHVHPHGRALAWVT